jgi:acyl-CoA thioesterase-1
MMRRGLSTPSPRKRGEVSCRTSQPHRPLAHFVVACLALLWFTILTVAAEKPIKIVALGDSLTAGYQLPAGDTFPARLEQALNAKGIAVEIVNAGVSGDTSTGGLARLDWSVPEGTDAVILELGANDMLRGVEPNVTREALDAIIRKLKERRIEVLLAGMLAPPNLGDAYARAFNPIYPQLAKEHGVLFYPFFLDGVAANSSLNLRDGMHPNAGGVAAIVDGIMPKVEELIARVRAKGGS